MLFIVSIVLAILTVGLLLLLAFIIGNYPIIYQLLMFLNSVLGVLPVSVFVGGVLFIFYFFLLSEKSIRYLEEITDNLNRVAKGDFTINIPVRTNDELGVLADNINSMTQQLKESIEEERRAERAKTELITSVSHDLRTPLTSILGYLGLVVNDRYRDELALRYYADIAYTKSKRLKELIDELFEYTRVSYGGFRASFDKINLVELLEQLTEEFVPMLQEAGMVCRLRPSEKEIYAMADANMLVRVFENLLTNGVRYGKDGKYIDILIQESESVTIDFINYGDAIDSQDLPYIFDRFYRVEKSRSQELGGAGLGLAIAKSIVEHHKGKIEVFSDNNETKFEVILPKFQTTEK
ncbi:sensor histidine kinase [Alkaliphilus crotonatoxidans]